MPTTQCMSNRGGRIPVARTIGNGGLELLWRDIANFQEEVGFTQIKHKKQRPGRYGAVCQSMDAGRNYKIKNSIVRKAHPYKTGDSVCDLCLTEKTCIVLGHKAPSDLFVLPRGCGLLNVRDEVLGHCPHKLKHKLIGRKPRAKKGS